LVTDKIDQLNLAEPWPGMKSCLLIESTRLHEGKKSVEHRLYVSSLAADAERHNQIVRSHWAVENSLHWVMDRVFREDESRIRDGFGAENMSLIKHIALNKLRAVKSESKRAVSLKGLRKKAGWDDGALHSI
jgi:predicted transposase YbfD/YdcC